MGTPSSSSATACSVRCTIAATLLAWLAARRTPALTRRHVQLALAIFLGTLLQAPIGLLAVASDLRWPIVIVHLLLSIALLGLATFLVLEVRALQVGRVEPLVPLELRRLGIAFTVACFVLIVSARSRPRRARTRAAARRTRSTGLGPPRPVRLRARRGRRRLPDHLPLQPRLPRRRARRSQRLFLLGRRLRRAARADGARRAAVAHAPALGARARARLPRRDRSGSGRSRSRRCSGGRT
jgi:hypothetical protein